MLCYLRNMHDCGYLLAHFVLVGRLSFFCWLLKFFFLKDCFFRTFFCLKVEMFFPVHPVLHFIFYASLLAILHGSAPLEQWVTRREYLSKFLRKCAQNKCMYHIPYICVNTCPTHVWHNMTSWFVFVTPRSCMIDRCWDWFLSDSFLSSLSIL